MRKWRTSDIRSLGGRVALKTVGIFLVLVLVASVNFFVFLYEGDIRLLAPKGSSPERLSEITEEYRIGEPLVVRYFSYLAHTFTGDYYDTSTYLLGTEISSFIYSRAVKSVSLVALSAILAVLVGMVWGRNSAKRSGTLVGGALHLLAAAVFTFPLFALALYVLRLNHDSGLGLPLSGNGYREGLLSILEHAALPLLCLTVFGAGYVALIARAGYIRAEERGSPRGSLCVLSSAGPFAYYLIPLLFCSLIVVERLYVYDGLLSTFFIGGMIYHDVPLAMACFFVLSAIVLFMLLGFRFVLYTANLVRKAPPRISRSDEPTDVPNHGVGAAPRPGLSLSRILRAAKALAREFLRSRSGTAALLIFIVILLAGLLADVISISKPPQYLLTAVTGDELQPPSLNHPLGTDAFGRDVYSMNLYASRFDTLLVLATGLSSLLIGLSIGFLGSLSSLCGRKSVKRVFGWFLEILRDVALAVPIVILLLIVIIYRRDVVGFTGCILLFSAFLWFWAWPLVVTSADGCRSSRSLGLRGVRGLRSSLQISLSDFKRLFWYTLSRIVFVTKFAVIMVLVVAGFLRNLFPVPEFLGWRDSWENLIYEAYFIGGFFDNWWVVVPSIMGIVALAVSSYFILNTIEGIFARRARRNVPSQVIDGRDAAADNSAATEPAAPDVDVAGQSVR